MPDPELPPAARDAYAAFRVPAWRRYSAGNFVAVLGRQMLAVAVGYEVFQRTGSAFALGLVGLAGALPVIVCALPAGQLADRHDRRTILIATQLLSALASLALVWLTLRPPVAGSVPALDAMSGAIGRAAAAFGETGGVRFGPELPLFYALLLVNGLARAFGWAARAPLVANLVPRPTLANAVTWGSSLFEIGCVVGPALGGVVIAVWGVAPVYALDAGCALAFAATLLGIRAPHERSAPGAGGWTELFSGLRFVWRNPVVLSAITLDMFAVLLGGATALLPLYAERILDVGPVGLGWLRAAPSLGAVTMALALAHGPPLRRAGVTLLWSVAGYGAAMAVFGWSQSFPLSLAALVLTGAFDNVSVVIRHTLVQLLTPDAMRGRVAAVNNVFIGSSNELGMLESGLVAARFGPVASVVAGGIGAVLVTAAVAWKWPALRRVGPLHTVRAEGFGAEEAEARNPG